MIYNITINEDKTVEIDKEIVVNQYENEIDELVFKLPFSDFGYVGVFKSPLNTKLELPIVDNKITIGSEITSYPGTWSLIIVGKKDETIFISNFIELKSCRNHLSLKNTQEIDKNIELLYLELQETLNKLENVDLDNVASLGDDLEEIKQNIKGLSDYLELHAKQLEDNSGQIMRNIDVTKQQVSALQTQVSNLGGTIGNKDTKPDGTMSNWTYWGLVRAEEAKNNTVAILELLTDADVLTNSILSTLEEL